MDSLYVCMVDVVFWGERRLVLNSFDDVAVPCLCSLFNPSVECQVLQVANEDAFSDLVCCGEVYEVEISVTITYDFKIQMFDCFVNFFPSHGYVFIYCASGVVPSAWDQNCSTAFRCKVFFKLFFKPVEPHGIYICRHRCSRNRINTTQQFFSA